MNKDLRSNCHNLFHRFEKIMKTNPEKSTEEFLSLVEALKSVDTYEFAREELCGRFLGQLTQQLLDNERTSDPILECIEYAAYREPEALITYLETALRNSLNSWNPNLDMAFETLGPIGVDLGLMLIGEDEPGLSLKGASILRAIGVAGAPKLRDMLTVDDPQRSALAILMELDPDAISYFKGQLKSALGSTNQHLSRFAIDALESVGDFGIPLLLELLADPDPFKQQNATNALIALGELAVQDLVDELDNPFSQVQQNAIRALKEIGTDAVPALKLALEAGSQMTVQNANIVLSDIKVSSGRTGLLKRLSRSK